MIYKKTTFCLLCRSEIFEEKLENSHFAIIRCGKCGFIHTQVRDKKFGVTNEIYSSLVQAKRHLETQKKEFSEFSKNIIDMLQTKRGKLLDVGCGFGWVVAEAQRRGFDAMGIDSSKVYVTLGKKTLGVNLVAKSLETFNTKERFDVIVLNHVLEHIKEPVKFLEKVKDLLAPGGEVLILCPNIKSLMFMLFKEKWYGLQPAQHISQFTPETISSVVERSGLKVGDVFTTSLYYNPPGKLKKMGFFFLKDLGELFGLGDQVVLTAKKPK